MIFEGFHFFIKIELFGDFWICQNYAFSDSAPWPDGRAQSLRACTLPMPCGVGFCRASVQIEEEAVSTFLLRERRRSRGEKMLVGAWECLPVG